MSKPIVPALIPKDVADVMQFTKTVSFASEIQLDVVDGVFVPNVSWPYQPSGLPKEVKRATDTFTLEVDLMVANPLEAATEWEAAGADMLVFHIETISLDVFKVFASKTTVSVGVSCTNDTPLETFWPYVEIADYVQLMGIRTIGSQAQSFDAAVLERIAAVKEKYPRKMISIDGSVNTETIGRLLQAGAHRFVSGSAILHSANPMATYQTLCELAA